MHEYFLQNILVVNRTFTRKIILIKRVLLFFVFCKSINHWQDKRRFLALKATLLALFETVLWAETNLLFITILWSIYIHWRRMVSFNLIYMLFVFCVFSMGTDFLVSFSPFKNGVLDSDSNSGSISKSNHTIIQCNFGASLWNLCWWDSVSFGKFMNSLIIMLC